MSVNVSPVQLHHPEFIPRLESALAAAGTAPGSLDLEITESVALHGLTLVEKRLQRIRGLGVAISIDDFGTGFSSLSYLDRLPAASLKLDHRFVRRLDQGQAGQLIIEAVIELGRRLGMRVVAEGVENERQARLLSALGCADAQGWLYAGAMPVDELLAWLAKRGK
jgi:EAL domain-containing protein (putative c-di-GMP-specific phosphodiesterase class I)